MIAPCIGAWVEMTADNQFFMLLAIAPCIGAWIEICAVVRVKCTPFYRTLYRCVD